MSAYGKTAARLSFALAMLIAAFSAADCIAGTETYGYDALGRLIRWVDSQGRVTEYAYDAVGNILSVSGTSAQQNPTVTSVTPASLRRGETKLITIAGTNLANVTVTPSSAGLTFSGLATAATQVTLSLSVADTVPLGAAALTLSNGQAAAAANLTIQPRLATLAVVPAPLAIPPDNAPRSFALVMSNADDVANTVSVTIDQATVAAVSPASVTFAAGETSKAFQITGKAAGQAVMTFSSPTLASILVPVFVTAEFQGINSTFAPIVGVQVGTATSGTTFDGTLASAGVGVAVGTFVTGISPNRAQVSQTTPVTIGGVGIPANATASITPPDGVTLGILSVAPDGAQATLAITVAASAPRTVRRLALSSAGVALSLARPDADQLLIVGPIPEIASISPLSGTPGTTINTFTVLGRNLTGATDLQFLGGDIAAGSSPQVSADGTALATSITISLSAQLGPRTVVVRTAVGDSDAGAVPANTFNVVNQIAATFDPIIAPMVGVAVGDAAPTSLSIPLNTDPVGVVVGAAITAVAPATGTQGQSLALTLSGQGFTAPATVTLSPSPGVLLGSATVAADGRSISVPVTIASDAVLGARAIQAISGAAALPFASPALSQFLVTAPAPQVQSIDPNAVLAGTSALTLTIRGVNFQGAQQVRLSPPDGVSIGTPQANPAGDTVTVSISVAANAVAGPRVLTVVTPAGESSATPAAANTLNIVTGTAMLVSPLLAAIVGVQVGDLSSGSSFSALVPSTVVGVQVGDLTSPQATTIGLTADRVGVAVGPIATGISPQGLVRGTTVTLTVSGMQLPPDASISINPATGLTIGTTQVAADGSSASTAIGVAVDAVLGLRGVTLTRPTTPVTPIIFAQGYVPVAFVNPGAPAVVSLSPILARQGETISLSVRGTSFNDLVAVTIEPADGVLFDSLPVVSSDKAQIDLRVRVNLDAAQGSRVIRVTTLGGQSSAVASPANTFTIFPP